MTINSIHYIYVIRFIILLRSSIKYNVTLLDLFSHVPGIYYEFVKLRTNKIILDSLLR